MGTKPVPGDQQVLREGVTVRFVDSKFSAVRWVSVIAEQDKKTDLWRGVACAWISAPAIFFSPFLKLLPSCLFFHSCVLRLLLYSASCHFLLYFFIHYYFTLLEPHHWMEQPTAYCWLYLLFRWTLSPRHHRPKISSLQWTFIKRHNIWSESQRMKYSTTEIIWQAIPGKDHSPWRLASFPRALLSLFSPTYVWLLPGLCPSSHPLPPFLTSSSPCLFTICTWLLQHPSGSCCTLSTAWSPQSFTSTSLLGGAVQPQQGRWDNRCDLGKTGKVWKGFRDQTE